ncbi:bifunctional 2-polyprenyl-6-hydroxyphenol methylase/3-demethylubiquinol 3-O-methyltransferase UbiG [Pseudomonas aeruginosa]|uniref:class I SAM-dependent methyltransferase n=1 Tax=Pseudomonas aeruginosa TaxID=287 RepID=UPI0008FB0A08|nr:class I SAM-dependent methyltransferase [Pseudomonas aeruginosa]MCD2855919.1 class I SAM-dependent methyltransferase [Pseudomonas aeruginosa]OPD86765.1 hypothetical protein AO957_30065 [Pseudomonas aeruginosa]RIY85012.1 hypothetical protein AXW92_19290 [Pseudomonas aeruginosa]HBO4672486.1 class I SAM-dependent methyltransferase [Pseudomonas aeruginosa]HCF1131857.1 class I SAM-dependent methyltransferase [Pseudomonas aeruginosa]
MENKSKNAWDNYNDNSTKYLSDYKKLYFSNVHRQFIRFLPKDTNSKILDIGCGSGRDALALAKRGYKVTAIEPSTRMLQLAKENSNHRNIKWLNDSLPYLSTLGQETYDFILLSAVWMHIAPYERGAALNRISSLMSVGSHVAITLRLGTPDPARIMYPIFTDDFLALAAKANLVPLYTSKTTKDSLNRCGVSWKKIVLQKYIPT